MVGIYALTGHRCQDAAMDDQTWRPLGFEGEAAATYDALHVGVPEWMTESFWAWMQRQFVIPQRKVGHQWQAAKFRPQLLLDVERVCRLRVGYTSTSPTDGMSYLRAILPRTEAELTVADYLVSRGD
jgi:hypothetical protein